MGALLTDEALPAQSLIDAIRDKPINVGDVFESTDRPRGQGDICDVIKVDDDYAVLRDRATGETSRIYKPIINLAMRRLR